MIDLSWRLFDYAKRNEFHNHKTEGTKRNEMVEEIVAKALDGQRYPLPPCEFMWMSGGKRGSGPEGADDLCLASLELQGWDLSLKAGI